MSKQIPDTFLANRFVFLFLMYKIFVSIFLSFIPSLDENFVFMQLVASPVIPIILYFVMSKKKVVEVIPTKKLTKKNLFLLIALGFAVQPAMSLISLIMSYLAKNPTQELIPLLKSVSAPMMFFLSAVMPAVLEEISFRGIIFNNYKKVSFGKAVFINGLLFALMHLNLQQSVYAMVMGIVFCFLVYHTQSIYSSIIVHFIFNATQIIKLYLLIYMPNAVPFSNLNEENSILYFVFKLPLAIISFCISFIIIEQIKKEDKNFHDDYIQDSEKFLSPSLIFYVTISILLMCLTD